MLITICFGINKKEYYDELKADIKKNGIKEPVWITFYREKGQVEYILGEGNHRVVIAKELNLNTKIPMLT